MTRQIAPRVLLYVQGSTPPAVAADWLALSQLPLSEYDGSVFGDGSHPTTCLCAGAVDLLCRQRQPQNVLDVGTGTGILARIARARGATFVVGTDIDLDALACAGASCALDRHPVEILLTTQAPDQWGARFDLVVANILEQPLIQLAPAVFRALRPGGALLLSGFTHLQVPALRRVYESTHLVFGREAHSEEWALLMFEK